jgi:hypothetical protein
MGGDTARSVQAGDKSCAVCHRQTNGNVNPISAKNNQRYRQPDIGDE